MFCGVVMENLLLIRSWMGSSLTRTEMGEVVNSELSNSDLFFSVVN